MTTKRPRITISWEPLDLISELINISILIVMWIFVFLNYTDLPDTIPIHFNASGEPDNFGNKMVLFVLPGIATFTYLLLHVLGRFPHLHNYMVNITEENAEKNYRLSSGLLRYINLFCLLIIGAMVYDVVNISKGKEAMFLNHWFLVFTLVAPVVIIIIALRLSKKINQ